MSQIKKVYMVTCGICCIEEPIYDVHTRKVLNTKLREFGWKKTKEHGWICPDCLEPEPEVR